MISGPHKSPPTIFIDRNSGGRTFKGLIEAAGIKVVLHSEIFKDDKISDHKWLEVISEKGWIAVTGDQATARSFLFLEQLNRAKTHVFIVYQLNGATREAKAHHVIGFYEWMVETIMSCEPPSLWRLTKHGKNQVNIAQALGRAKKKLKNSGQPRTPI